MLSSALPRPTGLTRGRGVPESFTVPSLRTPKNQMLEWCVHHSTDCATKHRTTQVNKLNKYWTETGASKEFGIPSTTLRHAWTRGDIETTTTACGLTLLYGPSIRKYTRKYQPNNKISGVIRRHRTALRRRGTIHAVPDSSMPEGTALCGMKASWGPAIKGNRKEMQNNCEKCQERVASKNVS